MPSPHGYQFHPPLYADLWSAQFVFRFRTFGVLLWVMKANEQIPNGLVYRVDPFGGSGRLCGAHAFAVYAQSSQPADVVDDVAGGTGGFGANSLYPSGRCAGFSSITFEDPSGDRTGDTPILFQLGRAAQTLVFQKIQSIVKQLSQEPLREVAPLPE